MQVDEMAVRLLPRQDDGFELAQAGGELALLRARSIAAGAPGRRAWRPGRRARRRSASRFPTGFPSRGHQSRDPTLRAQGGFPPKRARLEHSYRRSLRIQRERGLFPKKDRTIACLICAGCVK
jgi:hypothetical protein